jgi:Na+/phosphate symporter
MGPHGDTMIKFFFYIAFLLALLLIVIILLAGAFFFMKRTTKLKSICKKSLVFATIFFGFALSVDGALYIIVEKDLFNLTVCYGRDGSEVNSFKELQMTQE